VLLPLMLSWLVVSAAAWLVRNGTSSSVIRIALAAVAAFIGFVANVLLDRTAASRFLRSVGLSEVFKVKM